MTHGDERLLLAVRQTQADLADAREALKEVETKARAAIVRALEEFPPAVVAAEAGLSPQRIHQIRKGK